MVPPYVTDRVGCFLHSDFRILRQLWSRRPFARTRAEHQFDDNILRVALLSTLVCRADDLPLRNDGVLYSATAAEKESHTISDTEHEARRKWKLRPDAPSPASP